MADLETSPTPRMAPDYGVEYPPTAFMPWHVEITPNLAIPFSNTFWASQVGSLVMKGGGYLASAGSLNAECSYKVPLAPGTWNFEVYYQKAASFGLATIYLDGVQIGTYDSYNSSTTQDNLGSITGVAVASLGAAVPHVHTLKFLMGSNNASSTGTIGRIQAITLRRTA